jgi:hypothetical protein
VVCQGGFEGGFLGGARASCPAGRNFLKLHLCTSRAVQLALPSLCSSEASGRSTLKAAQVLALLLGDKLASNTITWEIAVASLDVYINSGDSPTSHPYQFPRHRRPVALYPNKPKEPPLVCLDKGMPSPLSAF